MKKIVTTALFLATFTVSAWADTGIFESLVIINSSIGANTGTYYYAGSGSSNTSLNGYSFGTASSTTTLELKGAQLKTWKNNDTNHSPSTGNDVTGAKLYYRVYKQGTTAPSFIEVNIPWVENLGGSGDQRWAKTDGTVNLLAGVNDTGTWVIEVYFTQTNNGAASPIYENNSGSNFVGTFVADSSLPISLASFTGTSNEDKATLNWVTVSELNSDHFDVEHSANGSAWKKVGTVQAAGNSIDLRNYSYTVEGLQVGTHSFRLKSVDKNGDVRYTASVQLKVEVPGQYVLYPAYPNPFNPATTITFAVATRQAVKAEVFNALGQKVRTLFNGTLEANVPHTAKFDAAGLQSGMYLVRVTGANFKATQNVTLLK